MEPDCRIEIPGPPRSWKRTGQRIAKRKDGKSFVVNYTPAETRADEWTLKRAAMEAMDGRLPFEGPIDLRITAWFPVPRSWSQRKQFQALAGEIKPTGKPDADNNIKLCDGLNGVVWRDDAQVTDLHFHKRYSDRPRTIVEVRCVPMANVS